MNYRRKQDANHPPTRLCQCGHIYHVHSRGFCGVVQGCSCRKFREDPWVAKLLPDSRWMGALYGDMHVIHKRGPQ